MKSGNGSACTNGQEWVTCVKEELLCSDLGTEVQRNTSCLSGCQCPDGSALQVCVCFCMSDYVSDMFVSVYLSFAVCVCVCFRMVSVWPCHSVAVMLMESSTNPEPLSPKTATTGNNMAQNYRFIEINCNKP